MFPWEEAMQAEVTPSQCPALEMLMVLSSFDNCKKGRSGMPAHKQRSKQNKAVLAPTMWQQKYYWPSGKRQNLLRKKCYFQALQEESQTLRINKLESIKYWLCSSFNICKCDERRCAGSAGDVWDYNVLKCLSYKALGLNHYMSKQT